MTISKKALVFFISASFAAGAVLTNLNSLRGMKSAGWEKLNRMEIDHVKEEYLEDNSDILSFEYLDGDIYFLETEESQYLVKMTRGFEDNKQGIYYEYYSLQSSSAFVSTRTGLLKLPFWKSIYPVPDTYQKSIEKQERP
ncbi:hypothetical protein [Salibacterium halotolerans]|uniref:DUF3139 domain-containing protein n=1 Tax=Salibacterium halotolerans TaxID=1884432 RepID=A0A1I5S6U2_9BACI|nr:hypothetical protein [Salibacterium halotolerans]SFP66422.1 hypothetical protein SAMN05518683_10871 [Salibacterium halotolerans]